MPPPFTKPPPWLVSLFDELLASTPGERRQMFGYPVGFLDDQLFCGLFGSTLFVRLGEINRKDLLAVAGAALFDPMGGRPMKEYVVIPPALLDDDGAMKSWLRRAADYARSLPPKKKNPRKKR